MVEASTRRFWRLHSDSDSWILMLSPPETENNQQFVRLSRLFRRSSIRVPEVIEFEPGNGLILVEDLGSELLAHICERGDARAALQLAIPTLIAIQQIRSDAIPPYTRDRFEMELSIFSEWVCDRLLAIADDPVSHISDELIDRIATQPQVTIHRDYHSRNLLRCSDGSLGVVDFQDALLGPLCYDLASLVHDCYFDYEPREIESAIVNYRQLASQAHIPTIEPMESFVTCIELTAIQRQLKAAGIFVRLWFQQGKSSHLPDVVPVLHKLSRLAPRHELTRELGRWVTDVVTPNAEQAIAAI